MQRMMNDDMQWNAYRQNDRQLGAQKEQLACDYLQSHGVLIMRRNFRLRQGEIDVIGSDNGTLIFVEVKYRKSNQNGYPEEAVHSRKQKQICKMAMFYYSFHNIPLSKPCRFDIVSICGNQVKWIKNAFDFQL